MEESPPLPAKRPRLDSNACLLNCSENDPNASLTSPQTLESWKTILDAAQIRKCAPVLDLAEDTPCGEIPSIKYHRRCRSLFTMKKGLDSILKKNRSRTPDPSPVASSSKPQRRSLSEGRVYEAQCIFCLSVKYLKGQRTREGLVKCCELRADDKIRKSATQKMDTRILGLLHRDLVAAEGHYHRTCYRTYTMNMTKADEQSENEDDAHDPDIVYANAYAKAERELFLYIRNELMVKPDIVSMTDMTSRLGNSLHAEGQTIKQSSKKHLRRALEQEFGETLQFVNIANGRLLVYPNRLTIDQLAKVYFEVRKEHDVLMNQDDSSVLPKAALHLRKRIKAQEISPQWPPDTQIKNCCVPECLDSFICTLLTGDIDSPSPSARVKRLANSFGQDLVYAVTNGRENPPKHVLLPFAVKSLTGNVELIQTLNRFGHSVSYSKLEEIDTALSLQKLSDANNDTPLPCDIHPGVFTTLAWDNIDRLEETLTGGGTSHRVNGIAVQRKLIGPLPPRRVQPVEKSKKRSIPADTDMIPIYNAGKSTGPKMVVSLEHDTTSVIQSSTLKNVAWVLARLSNMQDQTISSWTGFNIQTRDNIVVTQDTVAYLPTVNAPATELSTVYEVLNQTVRIMDSLQLSEIVCVFDQALYAKALEIAWKHPDRFDCIIFRMGVFHTLCTLLAIVGKRFGDAGLRDLCIESGLIADGSIVGVLDGRKYNRAVRMHKLVYEALMRIAWAGFLDWLGTRETDRLDETISLVKDLASDISQAAFQNVISNDSFLRIVHLFQQYRNFLHNDNGGLSAFWVSYLDLVEIMLGLLRATREGDWLLHIASIRAMIPWCFAYDRLNYARYLTFYYAQMSRLAIDHPEVYAHFMDGGSSVQIGPNNPFGKIPVDQTIEETVNKDTQTAGGTHGFSLNPGAVRRYYLNAEYRSTFLHQLRAMLGIVASSSNHPDLQQNRIEKDESGVKSVTDLIQDSLINPFKLEGDSLVSISSGTLAPADVTKDLLSAQTVGKKAYQEFQSDRLEKEPPGAKDFYATLKKQKLKTFTNVVTKKVQCKGNEVILRADRDLFARMIVIAQGRELDMRDVLSHPLGPIPWALANENGWLRKTDKARLMNSLGKTVPPAETIPHNSTCCIVDGMSVVQKLNVQNNTFGEVSSSVLKAVLRDGDKCQRIDVVFDVYLETSIKDAERQKRGSGTGIKFSSIVPGHKIKKWRSFLSEADNKTRLIQFLVSDWKSSSKRELILDKVLVVTCGTRCWKITSDDSSEIVELESSHEEADTRLLLHAKHAADSGYRNIIVVSEDTDVFVLLLSFAKDISAALYQKRGTKTRTQFTNISQLRVALGDVVCGALIGFHAFSGCDAVSAFVGRGKIGPLGRMKSNNVFLDTFTSLGDTWEFSAETFRILQHFTCLMYAPTTKTVLVNELRYELFLAKRGRVESHLLPPCEGTLKKHVSRANYQAGVWKQSLEKQPVVPDPEGHGWNRDESGILGIDWMEGMAAPDAVLEMMACQCKRVCKEGECVCLDKGLKCTPMCNLQNCGNMRDEVEDEMTVDIESDYDDDNDDDDDD